MNKVELAGLSTHTNVKDFCGQHKNLRVAARKNFHCMIRARVATVPCGAHSHPSFSSLFMPYAPFSPKPQRRRRGRKGPSWHTKLATCLLPWLISFSRAKWCCPDRVTSSPYSRRINCPLGIKKEKDGRVPHYPFACVTFNSPWVGCSFT